MLATPSTTASTMRAFKATDLCKHHVLGGLNGGPGHERLICKHSIARKKTDDYERTVWEIHADEKPMPLTSVEFGGTTPMLSHDGETIAFISSRGKDAPQVHLLPRTGGEAMKLTHASVTITGIEAWSHDDRQLLVTANCDWDEDHDPDAPRDARSPSVACYLPYKRDGSGIIVGERAHLYVVDLDGGDVRALAMGDFDVSTGRWSPDGKRLAFVRNRTERQRHRKDLWLARADGSGALRRMDTLASISAIAWSPDGHWLAIAGSVEAGDSMVRLFLLRADGDEAPEQLGGDPLELEPSSPLLWHPDGKRLAVVCAHRGISKLAIVSMPDGTPNFIDRGLRTVVECAPWGERLAILTVSMRSLDEIHSIDWNGEDERRHTRFNRWFRKRSRPRVTARWFDVPDGDGGTERVRTWCLFPANTDGPCPALFDMHGGPHSIVLTDYSAHTYWYSLLSKGWAIIAPDAVGSSSYGERFARRLRGRWGELDLPQYEAILATLQREGRIDTRNACGGKSYGGFLSAWAIGHTDAFRAAFVAAPVANQLSHFGTSDTGYYVAPWLVGAEYPEDPGRWHKGNAVAHLHKATTPTLILQGENDGRCPRGQGEEVFAHLIRYTETPVELVTYPTSTHGEAEQGRPSNRIDYHDRIVAWLERWVTDPRCVPLHVASTMG